MKKDREKKHIFLIGFMGVGKSTIAKTLHEMTQRTVIEMDSRIETEEGRTIADIFAQSGEEYFRNIETDLLYTILGEPAAVVSCGGGVPVREENRKWMRQGGYTILLTAEPETIFERVRYSKERPILNQNMSVEFIRELMERRRALYEDAADLVIWTDGKDSETIAKEILERICIIEETTEREGTEI